MDRDRLQHKRMRRPTSLMVDALVARRGNSPGANPVAGTVRTYSVHSYYPIAAMIDDAKPGPAIALAGCIATRRARLSLRRVIAGADGYVSSQTNEYDLDWMQDADGVEYAEIGGWSLTVWPSSDGLFWHWSADIPDGQYNDGTRYSGSKFDGLTTTKPAAKMAVRRKVARTMLG